MRLLSWNCRGLGNPWSIRALHQLVKEKDPSVLFLMETKTDVRRMTEIKLKMGFQHALVIPSIGRSGELSLIWKDNVELTIQNCSQFHIDAHIKWGSDQEWRLTGFYGNPDSTKRKESWNLLKLLGRFWLYLLQLLGMNDLTATTDIIVDDLGACAWKPKCGMQFDSEQDAYDFYNAYGGRVGFGIRRDTYYKNKNTGEMISRIFVCSKEGFRVKDKRDHLIKKPRQDATEVELAEESGHPLRTMYELIGRQSTGKESLGYTKQDQKNYLRTKRQRKLAYGEAGSVLKDVMNIMELPSQYILKRWTRKARVECVQDMHERDIQGDARLQHTTWYRSLCSIFTRISSRASENEETYYMVNEKARELLKVIEDMLSLQVNDKNSSVSCSSVSSFYVETSLMYAIYRSAWKRHYTDLKQIADSLNSELP
ncbi:hypothetical protein HHK36_004243 [Tetracentron sinense]|uniref:FAR1 domain-containing protein n=1 Tax=Tetracentron sinense TaxID=13715 RepID=A0A834ZUJ0_TETSI|nr:hypothetical protein HHK36_004243 [Tetracentron sinense]